MRAGLMLTGAVDSLLDVRAVIEMEQNESPNDQRSEFYGRCVETNSGSPLGAICSTVGVEAFDFARDEALRLDAFFAERLGAFASDALAFLRAGAFSAFLGLATLRAITGLFLDFLRFPPVAI
jgi:hypothetical protein